MKIALRFAALAIVLTSAFVVNGSSAPKASTLTAKSAAPVPNCPLGTPDGCGIGNW